MKTLSFTTLLTCLLLTASTAVAAETPATAATRWRETIHREGWSARALAGLGDSYASSGERGHQLLAYLRAQLLAPRDPAVQSGLLQAEQDAGQTTREDSAFDHALRHLSANEWSGLMLAAGVIACLGFLGVAWSFRRRMGWTFLVGGLGLATACAFAAQRVAPSPKEAVVLSAEPARLAPFGQAEALFTPGEGATVTIERTSGPWIFVRRGADEGWLPSTAAERVLQERADG
jgi:hypothetical protein